MDKKDIKLNEITIMINLDSNVPEIHIKTLHTDSKPKIKVDLSKEIAGGGAYFKAIFKKISRKTQYLAKLARAKTRGMINVLVYCRRLCLLSRFGITKIGVSPI